MATLLQHCRRPALRAQSFAHVPMAKIVAGRSELEAYFQSHQFPQQEKPEREALTFYLANAAYAQVRQAVYLEQPLDSLEFIVDHYHNVIRPGALRMFYYMLLICTRESRHKHWSESSRSLIEERYGANNLNFLVSLRGESSKSVLSLLSNFTPDSTVGSYVDMLRFSFASGGFNHGYGGQAWADIAKVLSSFVYGEISAEVLLDTAFTLCHNNGPIFNKGMLFTNFDSGEIKKILDVQRAGFIPQLVGTLGSTSIDVKHVAFLKEVRKVFPDFGRGEVKWDQFKKLGVHGSGKPSVNSLLKPKKKKKTVGTVKPKIKGQIYTDLAPYIGVVVKTNVVRK